MKPRILLVDYIGTVSAEKKPVGHALKVFEETKRLLPMEWDIKMAAPKEYIMVSERKNNGIILPCATSAEKSGGSTWQNIKYMFRSFYNIFCVMKVKDTDILWFYNVDQFLFMYLGLFGFNRKKIVVTMFTASYPKKYHNYFFMKVMPKISLLINTNPQRIEKKRNVLYIPDYLYSENRYAGYRAQEKTERVICLGTMNRSKQIYELVKVWNHIDYPLEIYGFFYDRKYYQEIVAIKKEHIKIVNEYIGYKEYLQLLGKSKFCILPYRQEAYQNTTSGVILESIFLGAIPVSSNFLLQKMNVSGIGYNKMEELEKIAWRKIQEQEILLENNKKVEQEYQEDFYKEKLYEMIETF